MRKKKLYVVITVLFVIIITLAMLEHFLLDGLEGVLWGACLGEQTEYASGYSRSSYCEVLSRMNESDLLLLLGEPIKKSPLGGESESVAWCYSRATNDGNYRVRVVLMERGVVLRKIHEFYVD